MKQVGAILAVLAWATAVAAIVVWVHHRDLKAIQGRLDGIEMRLNRLEATASAPAPAAPPAAVREPPPATRLPPFGDSVVDALAAIRDRARERMEQETLDEVGRMAATAGLSSAQMTGVTAAIRRETEAWWQLLGQWWVEHPDDDGSPFADPDFQARLQDLVQQTDETVAPLFAPGQVAAFEAWRREFVRRYGTTP